MKFNPFPDAVTVSWSQISL